MITAINNIPYTTKQRAYNPKKSDQCPSLLLQKDTISFSGKNVSHILCPDIWQGKTLKPEISERLEKIADMFQQSLAMDFKRNDLVMVGSMANYNYAKNSDIDLHLVTDFNLYNADERLLFDYFKIKRDTFNYMHCFKLNEHPVEISVENNGKNIFSRGRYSIIDKKWISEPTYIKNEEIPDVSNSIEYKILKNELDQCIANNDYTKINGLFEKIVALRKNGLKEGGELSIGNLVFKRLRNEGYIKKLVDLGYSALNNLINLAK